MDATINRILWRQFGAAIDSLEAAIRACPESLWGDRTRRPEFWYVAFHTLFWLDRYLSGSPERHMPPEPFGLEELDPAGVMPPRVYTQAELLRYLEYDRARCHTAMHDLTTKAFDGVSPFSKLGLSEAELHLYNLRHVQHHVGQLNLILRQVTDSAPPWVSVAREVY